MPLLLQDIEYEYNFSFAGAWLTDKLSVPLKSALFLFSFFLCGTQMRHTVSQEMFMV